MLGDKLDELLGRWLPASRKGALHRFYLRRAGDKGRWGLFIHRIMRSDDVEVFHNHPWDGVALVLGSYLEETPTTPRRVVRLLNRVRHRGSHRVDLPDGKPVWTIFLHFRRQDDGSWWFHDRNGNVLRYFGASGEPLRPWRGPDA
jgi:hypothetical protein